MKTLLFILSAIAAAGLAIQPVAAQRFDAKYGTKLVLGGNSDGITPLTILAPPSGLTSYSLTLPSAAGANGQTLVTLDGNGTLGWMNLSGTNNYLPKWSSGSFANSSITDDGTTVTTTENLNVAGAKTLRIGTASGGTGSLAFAKDSSAYLITLQAGKATASVTYKLPIANGTSGQVLVTDGSNPAQLLWESRATASVAAIISGQTTSNLDNNNNTDYYYPSGYTAGNNQTLSFVTSEMIVPRSGTIMHLYVGLSNAPGSNASHNFTVRNITTSTDLTAFSIAGTNVTGNSGSATLSVSAGDLIAVKHTATNSPANTEAVWSFELQ